MSALICPLPNPFAETDQDFEKINTFLSREANQLSHRGLKRQLGEMGQNLLRKLTQANAPAGASAGTGSGCRRHDAQANSGAYAQPGSDLRNS